MHLLSDTNQIQRKTWQTQMTRSTKITSPVLEHGKEDMPPILIHWDGYRTSFLCQLCSEFMMSLGTDLGEWSPQRLIDGIKGLTLSDWETLSDWRRPERYDDQMQCVFLDKSGKMDILGTVGEIWMGFPGGSVVKNSPANAGDMGLIPGSGRSPGKGNSNPF